METTIKRLVKIEVPDHWKNLTPDNPLEPIEGFPDSVNNM